MFQVRRLRVPETISAKTVKETTKAYERKSLHLLLLRSQAPKKNVEKLGGREQGERTELSANLYRRRSAYRDSL